MLGRHEREPLIHGLHLVVRHSGNLLEFAADEFLVRDVVALEIEEGGVAFRSHEGAEGIEREKFAPALAMLDDAGDTEVVVAGF